MDYCAEFWTWRPYLLQLGAPHCIGYTPEEFHVKPAVIN
jgi:hypothetical protein